MQTYIMAELEIKNVIEDIEELISERHSRSLLNILIDLHPSDIEAVLNRLNKDDRAFVFNLLPINLASEVLTELDTPVAEDVLETASIERISSLVDEMDSDDAADIIANLPDEIQEKILGNLDRDSVAEVLELMDYDEHSAGGIMAKEILAMNQAASVNDTIKKIREVRDEIDDLYNIWVVDDNNIFLGTVSLADLLLENPDTPLKDFMDPDVSPIRVDLDQEDVALFFKKYNIVSAPVVDSSGKLVGRITVDDIVDVLEEEGSEDMARFAGAPDEEIQEDSPYIISRARIPWLLVAFVGELIAATILNYFSGTIENNIIIALFIPVVMAMGGSSGQQASVTVVRGLATGDIGLHDTRRRLLREFRVSLLNSSFFCLLLFGIVYFWSGVTFAIILTVSMFIVINNATVLGALIPLVFKRLNIDPALAAAPLVSTTNDIIGILIYLTIVVVTLHISL